MIAALFMLAAMLLGVPQSSPVESLKSEPDKVRRADKGLVLGESQFDAARSAFVDGKIDEGNEHLDWMIKALDDATTSLTAADKKRLFKRAELRVANLQRRMRSLLDEISIDQRSWADQTDRQLGAIHDKLLEGALRK
jgi:hypothetical protein